MKISPNEFFSSLFDEKPNVPASESAGSMLAFETPMSALCDAAFNPASRTSGRRRNRSRGMPVTTAVDATGMPRDPAR